MKSKQKNNSDDYVTIDFGKFPLPWAILLSTLVFTAGIGAAIYFGLQAKGSTTNSDTSVDETGGYPEETAVKLTSTEFDLVASYLDELPAKGSNDSKVILVEFGDYSCYYCGVFFKETSSILTEEYIDTGKLKMYYVDFPRTVEYQEAQRYSVCVSELYGTKAFFAYHDELYANFATYYATPTFNPAGLNSLFAKYKIDSSKIEACAADSATQERLDAYQSLLSSLGGNSTPTFFIGKVDSKGSITDGELIVGAQPIAAFRGLLDEYLK